MNASQRLLATLLAFGMAFSAPAADDNQPMVNFEPAADEQKAMEFDRVDKDGNRRLEWLEAMQVQKFHKRWEEMDLNSDLGVDAAEYIVFGERAGLPVSFTADPKLAFAKLDLNGDGVLDWVESSSSEELRGHWQHLDSNDDLKVDEAEMHRHGKN